MKNQMSVEQELRLSAWFDGQLTDEDLTTTDVLRLQELVFSAVSDKALQRNDVLTFEQHSTLQ